MVQPKLTEYYNSQTRSIRYSVTKRKELKYRQLKFYRLRHYTKHTNTIYFNNMKPQLVQTQELDELFTTAGVEELQQCDAQETDQDQIQT